MKLRKPHRLGVVLLACLFGTLGAAVGYRLYDLQYNRHEIYTKRAERQHYARVVLQPERGDIYDRTGRPLAQSTGRLTVYINPRFIQPEVLEGSKREVEAIDIRELATELAGHLGESRETMLARLEGNRIVPVARRVRPEVADRVLREFSGRMVDGRGYWLEREAVRLYPTRMASAVIGYCSREAEGDNSGIAGLELQYNEELSGRRIEARASRSGLRGEVLEPWNPDDLLAARGNSLHLTLDTRIQQTTEEVLADTVTKFEAVAAGAVVMDVRSGAVLAMASYPGFDNNEFSTAPIAHQRNRILTDPLETGSVAKLFTAAKLVDFGHITPDTLVDCEGGFAVVEGRRLRDAPGHAPLRVVTFRESMRWSSNVGIVKAAQVLENRQWYAALRNFGFGAPTGIDLPGEGSGILYPVERWTRLSRTSLPMGYEIALTPIQIVAAISAISNGGLYFTPHVVEEIRDPRGKVVWRRSPDPARRIVRPTTSAIMRDLMQDVVDNGTGKKAIVKGYSVGGKTGTTRKSDVLDRREYIASFAGVLPINDPRLAIYLYVDAPKTAFYASQVAAPAFQEIASAAALHLGLPPQLDRIPGNLQSTLASATPVQTRPVVGHRDRMPDLFGLTMAAARAALPANARQVKFLGTGFVADQFPPAGDIVTDQTEIVLHFAPREISSQGVAR